MSILQVFSKNIYRGVPIRGTREDVNFLMLQRTMLKTVVVGLSVIGLSCVLFAAAAAAVEWRNYGGNKYFQRYSPLGQINRDNLNNLQVVWRRASIDPEYKERFPDLNPSNYLRSTPLMINGVLYASNGVGLVEASNVFNPRPGGLFSDPRRRLHPGDWRT
jgi:hypothetical protein